MLRSRYLLHMGSYDRLTDKLEISSLNLCIAIYPDIAVRFPLLQPELLVDFFARLAALKQWNIAKEECLGSGLFSAFFLPLYI